MNRGITGIFDEAPTDQPYPYISFGTKVEVSAKTFQNKQGKDVTVVLDVWTDLRNGDIHMDILKDLNRLFDGETLDLDDGYENTLCEVEWSTTIVDESMECRHTVCRIHTLNE